MPSLYAFSKAGAYGNQHHSVFPTVTRVNASSYSTGSYPGTHGLMGNTVYFPEVDPVKPLNTGEYSDLKKADEATDGHLLTAITLGEVLQKNGERMMVFSSGSSGQGLMQNHTIAGGALINPNIILPDSFKDEVIRDLGPIPAKGKPNAAINTWITDALLKYGLAENGPLVSAIWYVDPDGTAHADGIGSPTAMESIRIVDAQFGRILEALKSSGKLDDYNIIISADHGFVTHIGKTGLEDFLISRKLKAGKGSDDVIVAEGAIYVRNHDQATIRKIVEALQEEVWVGALFTRGKPGELVGSVAGTLSFESIHWDHARSGDILVDENWNDDKNDKGYKGMGYSKGVAGHGGISPYEVHIALIASGPSFKKRFVSELPTSNVDIAPTVLALHGLKIPGEMDGRVLSELFVGAASPALKTRQVETTVTAPTSKGAYKLVLYRSILGESAYVDKAKVTR